MSTFKSRGVAGEGHLEGLPSLGPAGPACSPHPLLLVPDDAMEVVSGAAGAVLRHGVRVLGSTKHDLVIRDCWGFA